MDEGKVRGFRPADSTARALLEHRLQEQGERFRVALEHSPVVVFNQDRDLRYTWINAPVLAWAEQGYLGRTDQEIVGGPEGQELMAIKRAVLDSGVGTRSEAVVTFQGERHYYDMTVERMRDSAGAILGITCCVTDITPIKRVAAERERLIQELAQTHLDLVRRNLELEALDHEKSRWLGMAKHDLRNPLCAILANCELIFEDTSVSLEQYGDTLKAIYSSSLFMLELLSDVLDISVIESGCQHLRLEPTDLRSLIEESIAIFRPLADQKGTHIEGRHQETTPVVVIDSRKILQVLQNLIGNAIKYSPSAAKIALSSTSDGQSVSIIVQDNGPGIPKDELNSIFTPFRRSRVAGAQHRTGLGLAICKWIVEMHGGKIWAENAVGGGAIFHISLIPRSEGEFTTAGTL